MGDLDRLIFGTNPSDYAPNTPEVPQQLNDTINKQYQNAAGTTSDTYMEGTKGFLTGNTGDPLRDALIQKQKDISAHDYDKLTRQYKDVANESKLKGIQGSIQNSRIQRQFYRKAQYLQEEYDAQKEMARARAIASIIGGGMAIGGAALGLGGLGGALGPKSSNAIMDNGMSKGGSDSMSTMNIGGADTSDY